MGQMGKHDIGSKLHRSLSVMLPGTGMVMKQTGRALGKGREWMANPWMVLQRAGHHMAPGAIGQIGGKRAINDPSGGKIKKRGVERYY